MTNKKSLILTTCVSLVVSVAAVLGVLQYLGGAINVFNEVNIPKENFGAFPGPSIEGKFFTIGGVEFAAVSTGLYGATSSVPCSIKNPWGVSTTSPGIAALNSFSLYISDGMKGAAQKISISTSTNALLGSTSTRVLVYEKSIAAGATTTVLWQPGGSGATSSPYVLGNHTHVNPAGGESVFFLRANEYVGVRIATSTPNEKDWYEGKCTAVFQKLY